jgi:4-diphosphocytidyl-2-C-methyl-D-erythritol kinase
VTRSARLYAPAKVNFRLDVLSRRPDSYHELRMIMQRIDLCDEIEITLHQGSGISLSCNHPYIPQDKRNIVWKAAAEILQHSGKNVGIKIKMKKNIPVGAGLGGGSSDAATTLMGLNDLLGAGLTDQQLTSIGLKLGADVPFFIFKKAAVVEGIGDRLSPLEHIPKLWLLLVNPGIHVSTSWVYQNLNLTSEKVAAKLPFLYKSAADVCSILSNDLEPVTLSRYPLIQEIKDQLLAAGAGGSLMSGSGSTVFAVFSDESAAHNALDTLSLDNKWFRKVAPTI